MQAVARGSAVDSGGRTLTWAFTGRGGGVSTGFFESLNLAAYVGDEPSAVLTNRNRAAALVGLDADRLSVAQSVHGGEVAVALGPGDCAQVDGLVTAQAGIGLLAMAADCVPLALLDTEAGVVGVAHCGWRGLGAGIVLATVARLTSMGARSVQAIVGPHICGPCYPVDADRVAQLRAAVSAEVAEAACARIDGRWHIDVGAGVQAQLRLLGVRHRRIDRCTAEDPGLFSYRRDPVTGRQGVLIAITPEKRQPDEHDDLTMSVASTG